jgi:hypothetical protein
MEKLVLDRNPLTVTALAALLASVRESSDRICEVTGRFIDEGPRDSAVALKFLFGINALINRCIAKHGPNIRGETVRLKRSLVDCYYCKSFLTTLNFSDDLQALNLDDTFAKLLCTALERNTIVRSVNLQNHQMTNAAAAAILPVLSRQECGVRAVLLDGNYMDQSMVDLVRMTIAFREDRDEANRNLRQLHEAKEQLFEASADVVLAVSSGCAAIAAAQNNARDQLAEEETLSRALLERYKMFLRYCAAWEKSFRFAFDKTHNDAKAAVMSVASTREAALGAVARCNSLQSVTRAINDPRVMQLSAELANRYLQFVTATALYEDKCVAALERVFISATGHSSSENGSPSRRLSNQARAPSMDFSASSPPASILIHRKPSFPQAQEEQPVIAPDAATPRGHQSENDFTFEDSDAAAVASSPISPVPLQQIASGLRPSSSSSFYVPDADVLSAMTLQQRTVSPMVGSRVAATAVLRERPPSSSSQFRRDQTPSRIEQSVEPAPFASPPPLAEPPLALRPTSSSGAMQRTETLEGTLLDGKLQQRYAKYVAQVDSFEKKCLAVLQSLFEQYEESLGNTGEHLDAPWTPPSRKVTAAGLALEAKLQDRYDRYAAGTSSFSEKCMALRTDLFEKSSAAAVASKRRQSLLLAVTDVPVSDSDAALIRQQIPAQITRAPQAKLDQVFNLLPSQPLDLQRKAQALIDNDRSVTSLDLSRGTNGGFEVTDITIGVLYTVLQGNNSLSSISFSGGALKNLAQTSVKALVRLAQRFVTMDLSGSRVADPGKLYPALLASESLKSLVLDDCDLTDEVLSVMLATLRTTNSSLAQLSVKSNPSSIDKNLLSFLVYYTECNRVASSIPTFKDVVMQLEANDPSVSSLKGFAFNANFTDAALRLLCIALTRNTVVRQLDVTKTSISDKGCRFLATLMKTSKALTEISIQGCGGVTAIGKEELRSASYGGRIALAM